MTTQIKPWNVDTTTTYTFANVNVTGTLNINGAAVAAGGGGGPSLTLPAAANVTAGQVLVLNSNSTVSPVTVTTVNLAMSAQTSISGYNFDNTDTQHTAVYDSAGSRMITAGWSGSAVVTQAGNVTGNVITWGSFVTITSSISRAVSIAFNPTSNTLLYLYKNDSGTVFARAGTISGTSITLGAEVTVQTNTHVNYARLEVLYHPPSNNFVAFYPGTSYSPTSGRVAVLSVTGTTVTVATLANNTITNSGADTSGYGGAYDAIYDPSTQKIIFASSARGRGYVGHITLTGTTLTFGNSTEYGALTGATEVVGFASYPISGAGAALTYDSTAQRVILAYMHFQPATVELQGVYVLPLTVSGTDVLVPSGTPYKLANGNVWGTLLSYNPLRNRTLAFYYTNNVKELQLLGNTMVEVAVSNTGGLMGSPSLSMTVMYDTVNNRHPVLAVTRWDAIRYAFVTAGFSTTTAADWVGIASANAASGANATIDVIGATNTRQTGLTPRTIYYVAANGALTTNAALGTAGKIGKAITSTSLLITNGNA